MMTNRPFQDFQNEEAKQFDAAWKVEVENRIDAYDKGEITGFPAEDVFERIFRR